MTHITSMTVAEAQLQSLQNMANNFGGVVKQKYQEDKRRSKPVFFCMLHGICISPILDYTALNHFLLGFYKGVRHITNNA